MNEKVRIGKALIDNVSLPEAVDAVEQFIINGQKTYVVTPNVDHVVKLEADPLFAACYAGAGLVLADGNPLVWASKILGTPLKERVTGSDLFPRLCKRAAQKGYRVFFLGGLEGVAAKAAEVLQQHYTGLMVSGTYSPPFGFEKDEAENKRIVDMINAVQPHLLFVGVGAPKQEKWMYHYVNKLDIHVALGIGASFDFEAGTIKRAPRFAQKIGMEWFWRFSQEPRRLFRRYFVDSARFLPIIYQQLKTRKVHGHE